MNINPQLIQQVLQMMMQGGQGAASAMSPDMVIQAMLSNPGQPMGPPGLVQPPNYDIHSGPATDTDVEAADEDFGVYMPNGEY